MNYSSLSASDRRLLIVGALVAVVALLSYVDPNGTWGALMILALLGGLAAVFIAVQPQVAPTMKWPMSKGMLVLAAGGAAVIGYTLTMLPWISYIFDHIINLFVILMVIGLIASLYLLWTGWTAYQAEQGSRPAPPAGG